MIRYPFGGWISVLNASAFVTVSVLGSVRMRFRLDKKLDQEHMERKEQGIQEEKPITFLHLIPIKGYQIHQLNTMVLHFTWIMLIIGE